MRLFFTVKKKRKRGRHAKRRFHFLHHVQEILWPSMGWNALLRWLEIRMKRHPDGGHKVAVGMAIGVGVSFLPFIGTHLVWIFLLCWLFRASFMMGALASFVGNPWTFPAMFLWNYQFGHFLLGAIHIEVLPDEFQFSFTWIWENLAYVWETYLWPMTIGAVPTGLFMGFLTYYFLKLNILSYRKARKAFLDKKCAERKKNHLKPLKRKVEK